MRKARYKADGVLILDTYKGDVNFRPMRRPIPSLIANCADEKIAKKITRLLNLDSLRRYAIKMIQSGQYHKLHRGDK